MKFKRDISEDLYKKRVSEYARVKNIGNALKMCDDCEDLEFSHRPGVCKRTDKVDQKLMEEQLDEIKQSINHDIIEEIIARAKSEEKFDDNRRNDRLTKALAKISDVLMQRNTVPS